MKVYVDLHGWNVELRGLTSEGITHTDAVWWSDPGHGRSHASMERQNPIDQVVGSRIDKGNRLRHEWLFQSYIMTNNDC